MAILREVFFLQMVAQRSWHFQCLLLLLMTLPINTSKHGDKEAHTHASTNLGAYYCAPEDNHPLLPSILCTIQHPLQIWHNRVPSGDYISMHLFTDLFCHNFPSLIRMHYSYIVHVTDFIMTIVLR